MKPSIQTSYLHNGDKRGFWGSCRHVWSCLRRHRGARDGHVFVLHVVCPITEGLNGISCRDRDIWSMTDVPTRSQLAEGQSPLLHPLPNFCQQGERGRSVIELGSSKEKSIESQTVCVVGNPEQDEISSWNLSVWRLLGIYKIPALS